MKRDRAIQIVALLLFACSAAGAGLLLPRIIETSDRHALRYTNVSVEGAPPFVALGQAMGALRGIIADILWIKVHFMKERGLFYEVMADAELITKLQPRFAAVWVFHGHNMAYNISVATDTVEERWTWVNAGIRLVRNEGLRYNPNNLELHKELAFWFAHKIEGVADDAHLYYKAQFCREWHQLLGQPPDDYEQRIEWIRAIAEAPETLEQAEARTPGVLALVDRLREETAPLSVSGTFRLDKSFLADYGAWQAVKEQSEVARLLGAEEEMRNRSKRFRAFDAIAADPELQDQWTTLIPHVRKRVLVDEYNMDPQLMYEYTRDLGPIDWRHGQAHALYWARRGSQIAETRSLNDSEIYVVVNNDRVQLQAMQGLARYGRIIYDPFSSEPPARMPDPRWIDVIMDQFQHFWVKHNDTRGWGGDTFIAFLQNFMASSVRELYRSGHHAKAREILEQLDAWFGSGAQQPNARYQKSLDVFVWEETRGEYEFQPHIAISDVSASLRYGFRVGIGQGEPEVLINALQFANDVTEHFKTNRYYDYETKFGTGRMKDLIGMLEQSVTVVFATLMIDASIPLAERAQIWQSVDRLAAREPRLRELSELRQRVYDRVIPQLGAQFQRSSYAQRIPLEEFFPEPPNMETFRQRLAEEKARRERLLEERRRRDEVDRN